MLKLENKPVRMQKLRVWKDCQLVGIRTAEADIETLLRFRGQGHGALLLTDVLIPLFPEPLGA